MAKTKEFFVTVVWLIAILLATVSVFWLDYRFVIIGVFLYYLKLAIFGRHSDSNISRLRSTLPVLAFFRLKMSIAELDYFLRYLLPPAIIIFAIILQVAFRFQPLVKI